METRLRDLLQAIGQEVPGFRIVRKDTAPSQRWIHRFLLLVSFGRMRTYLTHYVTTLGATVYVPPDFHAWDETTRVIVLHHERVHLRQFRRLGTPLLALLYGLVFFPVGLAYGRARLEWAAYQATVRATLALRGEAAARALRPEILRRFTGPDYLWMWPFARQVGRWFDRTLDSARASGHYSAEPRGTPAPPPGAPGS